MASLSVIGSTSAIGCCSEVASSSSNEDVQVFDETMGNNNTQYHTQMDMNSPFPKRESVNISFRNLKYTVNNFNFSKRQFGEFIVEELGERGERFGDQRMMINTTKTL